MTPFLDSFRTKYGTQSGEVVADSGYGNEVNYAHMECNGIDAYVKYNMYHVKMKRGYVDNAFLVQNMYYNASEGCYTCPWGSTWRGAEHSTPFQIFRKYSAKLSGGGDGADPCLPNRIGGLWGSHMRSHIS